MSKLQCSISPPRKGQKGHASVLYSLSNDCHLLQGDCCALTSSITTRLSGHCLWVKLSMLGERMKLAMTHAVAVVFDSCVVGHLRTSRVFKNSMAILQRRGEEFMRDY